MSFCGALDCRWAKVAAFVRTDPQTVSFRSSNILTIMIVCFMKCDMCLSSKVDTFITNGNVDHQFRLESASMSSQGSLLSSMARMQLAYLKVNGQFDRQRLTSYNLTITAVRNREEFTNDG